MYSQVYIPTDEENLSLINDHDLFKLLSQQKKVFLVIPADLEIQMENYIKSTIQCNDRMS